MLTGKADAAGEASELGTWRSHRGTGGSTCGENRGATREVCSSAQGWRALGQRRARKDRSRLGQMADGLVVPRRPGNAGGGKEP